MNEKLLRHTTRSDVLGLNLTAPLNRFYVLWRHRNYRIIIIIIIIIKYN